MTFPEMLAFQTVVDMSDEQLKYMYESFMYSDNEMNHVDFMITSQDRNCFLIKKDLFEFMILNEVEFRCMEFI